MRKQFDAIIGNPPFQERAGCGSVFWSRILRVAQKRLKDDGWMGMIHPPNLMGIGKGSSNEFDDAKEWFRDHDLHWVAAQDASQAKKQWGVSIPIIRYLSHKRRTRACVTEICGTDGTTSHANVKDMPFIPSAGHPDPEIFQLLAKPSEQTTIRSNASGEYAEHKLREERCEEYKHPVVTMIHSDGRLKIRYSNRKGPGFGKSKVLAQCFHGAAPVVADMEGEYAAGSVIHGLCYPPEEIPHVVEFMNSDRFKRIMKESRTSSNAWTHAILKSLRYEFYKTDFK